MLSQSQFKWLEDSGLALRGPECCDSDPRGNLFRAQIVFKQLRDYKFVVWAEATDKIGGVAAEKAYEAAFAKGAPPTPDQAYSEMKAKDAAAAAKIAELEAKIKEMSEKASAPASDKKPSQASK